MPWDNVTTVLHYRVRKGASLLLSHFNNLLFTLPLKMCFSLPDGMPFKFETEPMNLVTRSGGAMTMSETSLATHLASFEMTETPL